MANKVYVGQITSNSEQIIFKMVDGVKHHLPDYLHIKNHSPTGFSWGYNGSGPAQLALALLCDATNDVKLAERYYLRYKVDVVARLPSTEEFSISEEEINKWLTMQILKDKQ